MNLLFLTPLRYVASMAFFMESVAAFAGRGHRVDVLVGEEADPPFEVDHGNVRTFRYRDAGTWGRRYVEFFREAQRLAAAGRYDAVVGLSQLGLVAAESIRRRFGIPHVFYNDEIWFGDERGTLVGDLFGRAMKFLERRANPGALFTVTQDPQRGSFLAEVNRIPPSSLRYLPNSRSGAARESRSHYAHERFGFPPEDKVVLWLGAVSPGDGALELAREACGWPGGYRMLFHFRSGRVNPYMREILDCHGRGAVFVSSRPLPYGEVDDLAVSATIGLGLYPDQGINSRYIGASSGKINLFLKAGVPCIARDFEGLRWVEESGAGLCVGEASGVLPAAGRIVESYPAYRRRAVEVFEERLSFDRAFAPIAEELEARVAGGEG